MFLRTFRQGYLGRLRDVRTGWGEILSKNRAARSRTRLFSKSHFAAWIVFVSSPQHEGFAMDDMDDGFFISAVGKGHANVLVGDVFMPSERKKESLYW